MKHSTEGGSFNQILSINQGMRPVDDSSIGWLSFDFSFWYSTQLSFKKKLAGCFEKQRAWTERLGYQRRGNERIKIQIELICSRVVDKKKLDFLYHFQILIIPDEYEKVLQSVFFKSNLIGKEAVRSITADVRFSFSSNCILSEHKAIEKNRIICYLVATVSFIRNQWLIKNTFQVKRQYQN